MHAAQVANHRAGEGNMPNRVDKILEYPEANGRARSKPTPPEGVATFIRRVIRGEKFYPGPERRTSLRYPITMPVKAIPLNEKQERAGEAFLAVTREQLHVILEVVRCRQTGPFFEIAGRFVGQA
jgi:hypothetical protein